MWQFIQHIWASIFSNIGVLCLSFVAIVFIASKVIVRYMELVKCASDKENHRETLQDLIETIDGCDLVPDAKASLIQLLIEKHPDKFVESRTDVIEDKVELSSGIDARLDRIIEGNA